MGRVRQLVARVLSYVQRDRRARELDREIGAHIDMAIETRVRAGMSPERARLAALRALGGIAQIKEAHRDQQGFPALDAAMRDVMYAWRLCRARPWFAAAVMLTVALGVGANTAVFSVAHSVLWRPLPFGAPEHLVRLFQSRQQDARLPVSPLNYLDWASLTTTLDSVAAWRGWMYDVAGVDGTEQIPGARVSASLPAVLGVQPALGRAFLSDEDAPGGRPVAIISDRLWRTRFGGRTDVLDRTLTLGDTAHAIVGVLPDGVAFPSPDTAVWTPLRVGDSSHRMRRSEQYLDVIARTRGDVELPRVRQDLDRIARLLAAQHPTTNAGSRIAAVPLDEVINGHARAPLLMLLGVAAAVLLVACANVAHLLLARASVRGRELAMRAALGATRWRLLRQSLAETLLLACGGGALGIVIAVAVIELLRPILPAALPRREDIAVSPIALGFAFGCTLFVGLACAIVPALHAWRTSLDDTLKRARVDGTGRIGGAWTGRVVILVQITLSLVLLVSALLMVRSLQNVLRADAGFAADRVAVLPLSLPGTYFMQAGAFQAARVVERFAQVEADVGRLHGVEAAGLVNHVPLSGDSSGTRFTIEMRALAGPGDVPTAGYRVATPGYFRAMRARLIGGRTFAATDGAEAGQVFVINQTMARRFWPGNDPVGARIRRGGLDSTGTYGTIVGVVADMKQDGLDRAVQPEIFIPHAQFPWPEMNLVIRASDAARTIDALAPDIRSALRRVSPVQSARTPRPFEEVVWATLTARAFSSSLLTIASLLAVTLAILGVYAVTAWATSRRTREIAIRLALGAQPTSILSALLKQTLRTVALGLALGTAGAYAVARLMSHTLFGIPAFDLPTYIAAAGLLALIATLAAILPARRAGRTDPLVALRAD